MDYEKCNQLQSSNTDAYCTRTPSKCTYCCRDDSNCNAYNSVDSWLYIQHYPMIIITIVMTCIYMFN